MSPPDYKLLLKMTRILDRMQSLSWRRLKRRMEKAGFFERQDPDHSWKITKAIRDRRT